jgi:hypothetical protein
MVVVDEHSRMPVVEEVSSTASEPVIAALDKVLSLVGIPKVIKSDNGPPFNGARFGEYAAYLGFKHRKVTPLHPIANGQAESFMKNLGRVIRSANTMDRDWRQVLNEFLRNYRSTPHSTTGVAPAVLLYGENRTNRLPTVVEEAARADLVSVKERDAEAKRKAAAYADKRRGAKTHQFKEGDTLFTLQKCTNKWMTRFSSEPLLVTQIKGSMVTVKGQNGRQFSKDASKFKKVTATGPSMEQRSESDEDSGLKSGETRGAENNATTAPLVSQGAESGATGSSREPSKTAQESQASESNAPRRSVRERKGPERYTDPGKRNTK